MNPRLVLALIVLMLVPPTSADPAGSKEQARPDHSSKPPRAHLVLRNAHIYTVNDAQPWAEAIAVRGEHIVAVGSDADAMKLAGPGTRVVDLKGGLVLPGFVDAHVHLINGYQYVYHGCVVAGVISAQRSLPTPQDVLDTVRDCVTSGRGADGGWIIGGGFAWSTFADTGGPTREMLDAITGARPAYFVEESSHGAWVNSAALQLAGITRDTPDPQYGTIARDGNGEPSGYLVDYSAMELVGRHVPHLSVARRMKLAEEAIALFNAEGVVGMIEAGSMDQDLAAFQALADSGRLRVHMMTSLITVRSGMSDDTVPSARSIAGIARRYRTEGLNTMGAKIWLDGIPSNHSIAYKHDRAPVEHPWLYGNLTISPTRLKSVVTDLDRHGLQVKIHTVGDLAAREALEAIGAARQANGWNGALHHHLAHSTFVDPADIPRYAQVGAATDFQPHWSFDMSYIRDAVLPHIGEEAWKGQFFAFKTLADAGVLMASGSDWPSGPINPLIGMYVARTGVDLSKPEKEAFNPDERLSLDQLVKAATLNGATLMQLEKVTGSIETGKYADLIVLDRDIFARPAEELLQAEVLTTFFKGRPVYHADTSPFLPRAQALPRADWWR